MGLPRFVLEPAVSETNAPEWNGILEKYPGWVSWGFGAVVLVCFLGGLYLNAGGGH